MWHSCITRIDPALLPVLKQTSHVQARSEIHSVFAPLHRPGVLLVVMMLITAALA
jgi:hypothetical protein